MGVASSARQLTTLGLWLVRLGIRIGYSRPYQALPALAQYWGWLGNGRCLTTREPSLALQLACLEAGREGGLIGWVDEGAPGISKLAAFAARGI